MSQIAILDSGIGGTGVLEEFHERAPWADIVYLGDHAFGAYGERSLEAVRERTELIARYLHSAGIDLVVIACNTASAAALHHLRKAIPGVSFVGMEPAVKPAAERTRTGTVAVMATGATFQGELFKSLVGRFSGEVTIFEQACPGLARAVEDGESTDALLDEFLPNVAESGADVVVLGCTHYPLIAADIAARLPSSVVLIDPAPAVATRVLAVAAEQGIDLRGSGSIEYWTTAMDERRPDGRDWISVDIDADALAAIRVGATSISSLVGDVATMPVTAVVNAANVRLEHGGGIALAISLAGGQQIDDQSRAWIAEHGELEPGIAALTSAGSMPSTYVIHVAGPIYKPDQDNEALLGAAVMAALETAYDIDAQSVALPAISAGIYGYPPDEACQVIAESAAAFLAVEDLSISSCRLVGFDSPMAQRFADAINTMLIVD
jgi:glutamate racemase